MRKKLNKVQQRAGNDVETKSVEELLVLESVVVLGDGSRDLSFVVRRHLQYSLVRKRGSNGLGLFHVVVGGEIVCPWLCTATRGPGLFRLSFHFLQKVGEGTAAVSSSKTVLPLGRCSSRLMFFLGSVNLAGWWGASGLPVIFRYLAYLDMNRRGLCVPTPLARDLAISWRGH